MPMTMMRPVPGDSPRRRGTDSFSPGLCTRPCRYSRVFSSRDDQGTPTVSMSTT